MAFRWETLFGEKPFITVTNEERPYLGLDPIQESWDQTQYCSKCNITYMRTTVYWEGDLIRKVITEENRMSPEDEAPFQQVLVEYDTSLKTENRQRLLPLTSRGKPKPVTPSNILAVAPFGCKFWINVHLSNGHACMSIQNDRNNLVIPIGEEERISGIRSDADFHRFMDYYMQTCPPDYFSRIERLRTASHQTVRYQTGDIFRIEIDRFRYCYGLITGQVLKIRKWPELSELHSFRGLMRVPLMIRYYDVVTENPDLTAEQLVRYPLSRVDICADDEIIWGTHTIVGHKKLTEEDLEFNLDCGLLYQYGTNSTLYSFAVLKETDPVSLPEPYRLFVEWGTVSVILPAERVSQRLLQLFAGYHDPHGGTSLCIFPDLKDKTGKSSQNLLDPAWDEARQELFRCLRLAPDADFDDFAVAFGGLTKRQILQKM